MSNSQRQRDAWTQGRDQYQQTPWSATGTTTKHKKHQSLNTLFGLRRPGLNEDILAILSIIIIVCCVFWADQISDYIDDAWIEHEQQQEQQKNETDQF